MKNYIGISRDHSGSMDGLQKAATADYNNLISGIRDVADEEQIDTIVSVVRCGDGDTAKVAVESANSSISVLQPLKKYETRGAGTPLFDSVWKLIELLENVPDRTDTGVSFLIMVITDGYENASRVTASQLKAKIDQLKATDRWTFTFRVPKGGYKQNLAKLLGIPQGNIEEWDLTERGIATSTQSTSVGIKQFYSALKSGKTSTDKFYTDLSEVDVRTIKANLDDISGQVAIWIVPAKEELRVFVESHLMGGRKLLKGAAFYQLVKTEDEVQDYKMIMIRDRVSGKIYGGAAARDLLGLPHTGTVKVAPGDHGQYDVFIQSTSTNRTLPAGTTVVYWESVGVPYKEGKSSTVKKAGPKKASPKKKATKK